MEESIKKAQELLGSLPGVLEEYDIKKESVIEINAKIWRKEVYVDVHLYVVGDVMKFGDWISYVGEHVEDTRFYEARLGGFVFNANEDTQNAD